MSAVFLLVLAMSAQDHVERWAPLVLLAAALAVLVLRRRERARGPDPEDDLL